jgi:hypothetical protein
MAFTPDLFRRRARRAYELGRLRLSLPWAALAGTLGLLATAATDTGLAGVCLAVLAAATTATCVWYGGHVGRGVWPGLWVGGLALMLTLVAWACVGGGATSFLQCRVPCVVAGMLIAGGAMYHSQREVAPREALLTLLGTAAIATPLALIGCVGLGLGGMAALAAGFALGSMPAILRAVRAGV